MRWLELMGSFALVGVETGIRSIIFVIPTAFVARWCDVPLTWKSAAFMLFCIFWSDCVSGGKKDLATSAVNQKATADMMTPAEVAAEARSLGRGPKPSPAD